MNMNSSMNSDMNANAPLTLVLFAHSLLSDWNHGNAHFLRGVVSELIRRGHTVRVFEPRNGWSLSNLRAEYGDAPLDEFRRVYPTLHSEFYDPATLDLDSALDGADLVIVHEWNDHALVKRIGEHRAHTASYRLLFHDTHHRAISEPDSMAAYDLTHYDGVLAFGAVLRDLYMRRGWTRCAWTWHEAADTRVFYPRRGDSLLSPQSSVLSPDLVWIGNWGDDERTAELHEFLLNPVKNLGLRAKVHGVRYPDAAKAALADAGIEYGGWLPNFRAPDVFAQYKVTVHVPRRPYVRILPGIPTIRVFEALACGIPLVSAPWDDAEGLFTPGRDYLTARDGAEMQRHLRDLVNDAAMREEIAAHGLATIRARHTCAHRVDELLAIYREL
jgi:spore maturation protein CgeB